MDANMNKKAIFFCISINFLLLGSSVCEALQLFKNQLHIISSIIIEPKKGVYEFWDADEYIDRDHSISSIRLLNVHEQKEFIYYNDFQQRKLLSYDIQSNTCQSSQIDQVPLALLRRVLTNALPYSRLTDKNTEVAMGSSILLFVVEELLKRFTLVSSRYDNSTLSVVETYQMSYNSNEEVSFNRKPNMRRLMMVQVVNRNTPPAKRLTQQKMEKMEIISIQVCKMDNMTGNVDVCPSNRTLVEVYYFYINEIMGATLIGQGLDKSREFDFDREPFVQPIGIGCWDKALGCLGGKRLEPASMQFSAEFTTTNGSQEIGYVAYDGFRQILRLDKNNRKSVYDLGSDRSYHVGKFMAQKERTDSMERMHNCIVLNYNTQLMQNKRMLEILLGFSWEKRACHLGTKIIDHIHYEVYELELTFADHGNGQEPGYLLPLLLEASQFSMPTMYSQEKRYFVTYYVQEYPNSPDVNGFGQFEASEATKDYVALPKFIELWEYNTLPGISYDRKLINRLDFIEFSWSLDVEPSGDPEAGKDLSRIFNIESCSHERSHQLQINFRVGPYAKNIEEAKQLAQVMDKNPHMIREILHEKLSSQLNIPRLNIVKLDIFKQPADNSLLVDARVVDLHAGITKVNLLGFSRYLDTMEQLKGSVLMLDMNRHSLEECRLDSMANSQRNILMYCQGLTLCVLLKENEVSYILPSLKQVENFSKSRSGDVKEAECRLEVFSWAQLIKEDVKSVVKRVKENSHRLIAQDIRFNFRYRDRSTDESRVVTYRGYTFGSFVKLLDPKSSRTARSSLAGLRFTTTLEEPASLNMNMAFNLQMFEQDKFMYCSLACQADEFCGSFSFCTRRLSNNIKDYDCILSTMWLNSDSINEIDDLIRSNKTDLRMRVTSYSDSQEFQFRRDSVCGLHPKDFLSSYKMAGVLRIRRDDSRKAKVEEPESVEVQQVGTITTLEDCAEQDYEASMWPNMARTNFTYCPLGSACILFPEDIDKLPNNSACYSYERSYTQFYWEAAFTRMSIRHGGKLVVDTSALASALAAKKDPSQAIREELERARDSKLARSLEGLTTEQCARDCNLMQSKCLAFDSCTFADLSICNLYSVRSTITKNANKLLGFLPVEKQFFDKDTNNNNNNNSNLIKLYGSPECNHFYLKDSYFNIRLQQLLELSKPAPPSQKDTLEQSVLEEDQDKGDKILKEALDEQQRARLEESRTSSGSGAVHIYLLLFGAIVGSLSLAYGSQSVSFVFDQIQARQARRVERHTNHRISQLVLTNNLEI